MILKNKTIFFLIIVAFAGYSCKMRSMTSSSKKGLSERDQINLEYTFYDACKEKLLGNTVVAATLYEKCLKIDANNDAVLYELGNISFSQNNFNDAEKFVTKAISVNSNNQWYYVLLANIYKSKKQFKQAAGVYEELTNKFPNNPDYFENQAMSLIYDNDYAEAIKVLDKIEEKFGFSEEITMKKLQLLQITKKYDQATEELNKLIALYPKNTEYMGMLAELYMENGDKIKSLKLFNDILAIDSTNAKVHLSLSDYYRTEGDKDKSFSEMKKAFQSSDLDIATKIQILLSYFTVTEKHDELKIQAYELIQVLLETDSAEAKVHSIYADFLYRDKKLGETRQQYRIVTELSPDKYVVWQQLLFIDSEMNDFKSLLDESEKAIELFPSQPMVYLMNGLAKMKLNNYRGAITILEKGKDYVIVNDKLLAEFYTYIGDCRYELKEYQPSFQAYEKVISIDPKNALVLNNYSYYLSEKGDSLQKAEKMATKANEINPNVASYEDTYAWVLYKLGKFDEAKKWIEKAISHGGSNNDVIIEHYGDILFRLNKKDEALKTWKKAREFGKGSEFLDQKIKEEKIIE